MGTHRRHFKFSGHNLGLGISLTHFCDPTLGNLFGILPTT